MVTSGETTSVKAILEKVRQQVAAGHIEAALDRLEEAYRLDPENQEVAFKLAWYLDLHGEDERAIEIYEALSDLTPTHEGVLLNLSVLYEDGGFYDDAEEVLHRLLTSKPNHPRGRIYYQHIDGSTDMVIQDDPEKRFLNRNILLDTPVTDFELSVRARNCLRKMNIRTLGDLLKTSEENLLSYKNFGETSLEEIKVMLARKGLRLGQASEDLAHARRLEMVRAAAPNVPESVLNQSVEDLELSVRAARALERLNITTVGDLASRTEAEMLGLSNFGETSLNEIKQRLAEVGLTLRKVT